MTPAQLSHAKEVILAAYEKAKKPKPNPIDLNRMAKDFIRLGKSGHFVV
jgi:hypothetical protein